MRLFSCRCGIVFDLDNIPEQKPIDHDGEQTGIVPIVVNGKTYSVFMCPVCYSMMPHTALEE